MLSLLWLICDIIGLIFIVPDVQILKKIPTIWSLVKAYDSVASRIVVIPDTFFKILLKVWVDGGRGDTLSFKRGIGRATVCRRPRFESNHRAISCCSPNLLWHIFTLLVKFWLLHLNGQILKNNLATWSHWIHGHKMLLFMVYSMLRFAE